MVLHLNALQPADGARTTPKRVGRGMGSGLGKTAGRGHKGSYARKGGGKIKAGFEGGQTPMQRRLPKIGFRSRKAKETQEVFLYQLEKLEAGTIDIELLKKHHLVPACAKNVKIVLKGAITKSFVLKSIKATEGSRRLIESAGGRIEE